MVLIYTRQETNERHDERRRLSDKSKGTIALQETSRTPTIVLSCLRIYFDAHGTFSNARSCLITRSACKRKKHMEESFPNNWDKEQSHQKSASPGVVSNRRGTGYTNRWRCSHADLLLVEGGMGPELCTRRPDRGAGSRGATGWIGVRRGGMRPVAPRAPSGTRAPCTALCHYGARLKPIFTISGCDTAIAPPLKSQKILMSYDWHFCVRGGSHR
jgi:hypothetical protein